MPGRSRVTDSRGTEYEAIDRCVGLLAVDPLTIHAGLPHFLAPAILLPRLAVVEHRQLVRVKQ